MHTNRSLTSKAGCQSQPPRRSRCVWRREKDDEMPMVPCCYFTSINNVVILSPPVKDFPASLGLLVLFHGLSAWFLLLKSFDVFAESCQCFDLWTSVLVLKTRLESSPSCVNICWKYILQRDCLGSVGWFVGWSSGELVGSGCWSAC